MISDPVKGIVSVADISDEAGPLPETPEPARIEVFTNPSAGQAVATPVRNISTGIVDGVSLATSERLSSAAAEQGAQLTPEVAAVIGGPVRADITEAQPVGPDSGNGQSPFFLAFLVNLSGLIGGAAIFFLVGGAAEHLEARGLRPSRTGLWTVRLLLGFVYGALVAGAELWVAFGLLGVEHEASTAQVYLFAALATTAAASVTMLLAVMFGAAGIGISAILNVILGLVSSGGLAPLPGLRRLVAPALRYRRAALPTLLRRVARRRTSRRWLERFPVVLQRGREIRGRRPRRCRMDGRRLSGERGGSWAPYLAGPGSFTRRKKPEMSYGKKPVTSDS